MGFPVLCADMSDTDITDLELQALVDGELNPADRRALMGRVITCPRLLDRLEVLLKQRRLLQQCGYSRFSNGHLH